MLPRATSKLAGEYECRVDYLHAPSATTKVKVRLPDCSVSNHESKGTNTQVQGVSKVSLPGLLEPGSAGSKVVNCAGIVSSCIKFTVFSFEMASKIKRIGPYIGVMLLHVTP